MEKRYLAYKIWNGRVHSEIQYGIPQTGEGVRVDPSELKRVELLDHNLTLDQAVKIYPYEEKVIRQ